MARQISMEAGLVACRVRLGELIYQNVLLGAQLDEAEAEIERLKAEVCRSSEPPLGGPVPDGAYTPG